MLSLQQITDAWGGWMAQRHRTSCRFTASTKYADQKFLNAYHQYQCQATFGSISYDTASPPKFGTTSSYKLGYTNRSTAQQSDTFSSTTTTQKTFTWSITESAKLGLELSATEGVPAVASSSQKLTIDFSTGSTQGQSISKTQSWTVSTPVVVPPESVMTCELVVDTQTYDIPFTKTITVTGNVAIWFNDKVNLDGSGEHWLWFLPVQSVLSDVITNKLASTEGYQAGADGIVTLPKGVFTGSQGVGVSVTTTQSPLNAAPTASETLTAGTTRYYPSAIAAAMSEGADPVAP